MNSNQYFNNLSYFNRSRNSLNFSFFNVMCVNIRSVSSISKFNKFKSLIANMSKLPNVIAIQETWFQKDLTQLYAIPGYNCVHSCREDGYGGTSLYICDKLKFSVDYRRSENFVEFVAVSFENFKIGTKPLRLMSYYRSQKCSVSSFLSIIDEPVSSLATNPLIVLGDSNIDLYRSVHFGELKNLFLVYDCQNCHEMITRPASNACIDHVFSNFSSSIAIDSVECGLTDHNIILCKFKSSFQSTEYIERKKFICDYYKVREHLQKNMNVNLTNVTTDCAKDVISMVSDAVSNSTSEIKYRELLKYEITPWINRNLQNLIEFKEKLLKKRRKCRSERCRNLLRLIGNVIKKAKKKSRINYYSDNLEAMNNDPRKGWRFLNNALGRCKRKDIELVSSSGLKIVSNQEKADALNQYFLNSVKEVRREIDVVPGDFWNFFRTLNRKPNRFVLSVISQEDLDKAISNLKPNKSVGYDNITTSVILKCKDLLLPVLLQIFNLVVRTSNYPNSLKINKIVPIPKVASASSVECFRPIAILSVIDKVFEKIIHEKLLQYFEENNFMYKYQFGFRKGCGTEEAVVNVVNFICDGLDHGYNGVGGLFLDLSKAFDIVDHDILLQKMSRYGIQGKELLLFKSFLTNRKQYVQIMEAKSALELVEYGVPQGSCLGPLLFKIFINDLFNLNLDGRLYMFADDICLFYPYKSELVLRTVMERDASLIFEYFRVNKLVINANKTKLIRFKPRPNTDNIFSVNINGNVVHEVHSVKYLGISLQSNLSWDMHINDLKSRISPAIGILYKMNKLVDKNTKLLLYNTLIQSHLNYLAIIYGHDNTTVLRTLQRMQNRALKVVFNLPRTFSTLSLYTNVCRPVLPVHALYEYQLLMYTYKTLKHIGYHTICFSQNQNTFFTRNQQNIRTTLCRFETTKQRIEYMGSTEYNKLPTAMKNINTVSRFKSCLKEYISENFETFLS